MQRFLCIIATILCSILLLIVVSVNGNKYNPITDPRGLDHSVLDEYMARPTPEYTFNIIDNSSFSGKGYTGFVINMTSQSWLTPADVSQTVWWHFLSIIIPTNLAPETANTVLLYATGGNNKQDQPIPNGSGADNWAIINTIVPLGVVGAILQQIPNQPLQFTADPEHRNRNEDNLIAFAWKQFLLYPNRTDWLPRLPMVKSVVRAMDTIQTVMKDKYSTEITQFITAGASKRGWTAWLCGAILDNRIIGTIPIVMSELNFVHNIHHHYRAYGGWSFALKPYWDLNFTMDINTPNIAPMMNIIDPYSYTDRLALKPHFLVSASGDEFFLPDDPNYWLNQNGMNKNFQMRIMPNCEHSMAECIPQLILGMQGWLMGILYKDQNFPQFTYTNDYSGNNNGTIRVNSISGNVSSANMWYSHTISTVRRDFRLVGLGSNGKPTIQPILWFKAPLKPQSDGSYIASMPMPEPNTGWSGYYIEVIYNSVQNTFYHFTTSVSIIPDYLPFPDCVGQGCIGVLV